MPVQLEDKRFFATGRLRKGRVELSMSSNTDCFNWLHKGHIWIAFKHCYALHQRTVNSVARQLCCGCLFCHEAINVTEGVLNSQNVCENVNTGQRQGALLHCWQSAAVNRLTHFFDVEDDNSFHNFWVATVVSNFHDLHVGDLVFLLMTIGMNNSSLAHCTHCLKVKNKFIGDIQLQDLQHKQWLLYTLSQWAQHTATTGQERPKL